MRVSVVYSTAVLVSALREVIIGGGGGYNSKRQSLATLRSQRLVLHRPVKVKLR
jgi:hypothetical protein